MKEISNVQAINLALDTVMSENQNSVSMGLGHNDPKRIFGTTINLVEQYGDRRCIEPPTSENAITGICFGMSLIGVSVCLTHQRFDFSLLSFDQIINSVAKWSFMFNRDSDTSFLIRLIVGRGWGQGPTHSQSYHSFLASVPGLDVYYPLMPSDSYKTILKGMTSGKPTIMIEHRWLHNLKENKKNLYSERSINELRLLSEGKDFTVFSYGYPAIEALKSIEILRRFNISIDLIVSQKVIFNDLDLLIKSIAKTKNLLIIEPYFEKCSASSSLFYELMKKLELTSYKLNSFEIISLPFESESSSIFKTRKRFSSCIDIAKNILKKLNVANNIQAFNFNMKPHDIPGEWFKGPF